MVKTVPPGNSIFLRNARLEIFTMQYLIQVNSRVTRNTICYFVVFFLHISGHVDHLRGGHLQRNTFVTNAVKMCVYMGLKYNVMN
jgi:hypothetical protein